MKIILASKSGVRKQILDKYNIDNEVILSNVNEDDINSLFYLKALIHYLYPKILQK